MAKPGRKPNYAHHLASLQQTLKSTHELESIAECMKRLVEDNTKLKQENAKLKQQHKNAPKPMSMLKVRTQVENSVREAFKNVMTEIIGPQGMGRQLQLVKGATG